MILCPYCPTVKKLRTSHPYFVKQDMQKRRERERERYIPKIVNEHCVKLRLLLARAGCYINPSSAKERKKELNDDVIA
jgi:hypothetical protein